MLLNIVFQQKYCAAPNLYGSINNNHTQHYCVICLHFINKATGIDS